MILRTLTAAALVAMTLTAATKVREVDCDENSIQTALSKSKKGDTLRVSGTCRESIVVTIDRLTIDGRGTAVFDGGYPGVSFAGDRRPFFALIIVDGARGVTMTGLTLRNSPGGGFLVQKNSSVSVLGTKVQNNFFGAAVRDSSHLEFGDSEITGSTDAGLGVLDTSAVEFTGTVRINQNVEGISGGGRCNLMFSGALLEASGNKGNGISLSGCYLSPPTFVSSHKVIVNDNGGDGLFIGGGQLVIGELHFFGFAGALFQEIVAQNNKGSGINLAGFASIANLGGGKFDLQGNAVGLSLGIESSILSIGGIHVENNGTGILADGGGSVALAPNPQNPSVVQGNRNADVDLRFGTRATVVGVTIGKPLKCDGTVLSSGTTKCP